LPLAGFNAAPTKRKVRRMTQGISLAFAIAIDCGRAPEFGYFLIPDAGLPAAVLDTARPLDRLGYDLIGIQPVSSP
jgi:hypothetical protein